MPSEPDSLTVATICDYLTETNGIRWRQSDWNAMKMVKALKGDDINGTFQVSVNGEKKTYKQNNAQEFVKLIPRTMLRAIEQHYDGKATLVPIPNSHVTAPDTENFKTLDLAESIAEKSEGRFTAVPALVFKAAQQKARKGGPRSPLYLESVYKVIKKINGPVILIDDVCTLGGHLIGATWKLRSSNCNVVLACTFGATTKEPSDHPIKIKTQTLSLERGVSDFCV